MRHLSVSPRTAHALGFGWAGVMLSIYGVVTLAAVGSL